jgi:hypothetical protein
MQQYADWGKLTNNLAWRPNLGIPAGLSMGMPYVYPKQAAIDFAWISKYRCKERNVYSRVFTFRLYATWTGAVDNNWENAANWSCGVVPDVNTDVTIAAGSVTINQCTTIRILQINPVVSISVGAGVILNIRY